MIEVEHLTKRYGSHLAVSDLSFTVDSGQIYGFLGPNGAGKSTTMNIMTGCLSATEGSVRIDGHDIFEEPNRAKKLIGYLPEQPPLYLNETPEEYLRFVGRAKGLRGAGLEQQMDEVICRTGIEKAARRRISALSKGYRQRVGIAQALLGGPGVIILDEPTVGLDPIQIIEIRDLIQELGRSHTVIFSSHILSEVQTICDQIIMIAKGRLVAFDTPENLERHLLTPGEVMLTSDAPADDVRALLEGVGHITGLELEEADCVMICAPSSDISQGERELLADYTAEGGKLFVVAGPVQDGILENLYSLLADYGVQASEGIVVEGAREHYNGLLRLGPLALLPDLHSSGITNSLIEENYSPVMPISLGLTVTEDSGSGTVTELLTTSDMAYSKLAGYGMADYEKEDGDIDGPFALAVFVETAGEGQLVWFTSSYFLEDMYNAASSGANSNLGMNALSSLVGETEAMAIRSKSLNYNYLTISDSTASLLKTALIGVFPLLYLGAGVLVVLKRRGEQHEPI